MRQILLLALFGPVVAGCGLRGEVESRRFDLEWTVTVEGLPAGARSVVLWIPVPQERPEQRVVDPRALTDYPWEWVVDPDFGNRLARVTVLDPADTVRVRLAARVERYPVNAPVPESLSHTQTALYLREEGPIRLSPWISALADSLGRDPRRCYDYVLGATDRGETVPGRGQGDPERAGDVGQGNCTDDHSLFMSLCRAGGTPAVFETGLATRPEGESDREGGAHCWAWFYRNGAWVPVDIFWASLDLEHADWFGHLDPDRITFSRGLEIRLPGMQGPPVDDLAAGAYAEVDGAPFTGVRRELSYRPAPAARGE